MPVRFASAATATASPAVDAPTWSCETCAHVDERAEAWCSTCECSRVAGDPRRVPRDDARREREETDASETRPIERRASAESDAATHRSPNFRRTSNRTMHDKVSKLVNRLAAPATTVFNGALVGAFAVAGASVGALAGAVAARAASRGVSVLRGAGVGAVAGAAVSVEALDLARLCLSGYTVAGAMERRESRLALLTRDAGGFPAAENGGAAGAGAGASAGRRRGGRGDARRDGDSGGREPRRRARGRRFAARTFAVASSGASGASGVDRRAESPARDARAGAGARPLAIRARRAEEDARAREMERALARGDVERILHELFRGGSQSRSHSLSGDSEDGDRRENLAESLDAVASSRRREPERARAEPSRLAETGAASGPGAADPTRAERTSDDLFDARATRDRPSAWRGHGSDRGDGSGGEDVSDAGSRSDGSEDDDDDADGEPSGRANASWTSTLSLHRALEAMLTASRLDTMTYEELLDRFGPGDPGTPVAPAEAVRAIPTRRVTRSDLFRGKEENRENDGFLADDHETRSRDSALCEPLCVSGAARAPETRASERCCVCLEAWAVGAETKSLGGCRHTFHAACIDRWLTEERNACPVCRRAVVAH